MRRMRYVIPFAMPDKECRYKIWESCLITEMPVEDINIDYLSEQFTLSGSNIKNIILMAAFTAASQNSAITMKHILEATIEESKKIGKKLLPSDFGFYEDLFS